MGTPGLSLARVPFRYLAVRQVVHVVSAIGNDTVEVVCDPANGVCEWVVRTHAGITRYSNDGYGNVAAALRDGLIAYFDDSPCVKSSLCAVAAS